MMGPGRALPHRRGLLRLRGLFQHDMGIGAAEAEGADPGTPAAACAVRPGWPGLPGGRNGEAGRVQPDQRVDRLQVQVRRDLAVSQAQDGLDQAGDSRRRFQMADAGLDRAERTGLCRCPPLPQDGLQRLDLDRVAQPCPGAMRLDETDRGGGKLRVGQGLADHRLLRQRVRRGQAVAATVLIDRGAPDDGKDAVAVAACVAQPLQNDEAAASPRT